MTAALVFIVFPACMVYAAVSDIISMTIGNRISLILIAAFAILAPMAGMAWPAYGMHFAAGATVLCATFALFAIGGIGGGDAKLLASTALWMGFGPALANYLVVSAMVGGVLTLLIVIYRRSPLSAYGGKNILLRNFANPDEGIPYGVALGIGGLIAFPQSPLMLWALERFA